MHMTPFRPLFLLLFSAACAAPYADSLTPPRAEVCTVSRSWTRRPTACARLVGTVVDVEGRPVPNGTVGYALKDRSREGDGVILTTETDANGNFLITLYRMNGRETYPDTATVSLFGTTVALRRERVRSTPRWQGLAEAVVTYARVGGTLVTSTSRIVVDHYVPK